MYIGAYHCSMLSTVFVTLILVFQTQNVASIDEKLPGTGQCIVSDELESLRYRLYSELADNKKEMDSLKNDLEYWKNETLNILKKYLVSKGSDEPTMKNNDILQKIDEKLDTQMVQLDHCNITEEIVNEVRTVMESYKRAQSQELREIISEMSSSQLPLGTFLNPVSSCKYLPENSSSGNYWIQNAGTGYASLEYCEMNRRCCESTGGWMRVAHLDMTDPTHRCPSGFKNINSPKRTCGRPGSGCYSTSFSVDGIAYSRVCGKIKAYQQYSPDAFYPYYANRAITIDDLYVDGVSLTHGQNPRKHIWTFAAAVDETRSNYYVCPCTKTDSLYTGAVPPFIGNEYFCETGSRYSYANRLYSEDPLWDGAGCGGSSTCCQFNNPPWFCKQLFEPTTDNIELRLCADSAPISNEDIAIESVEIFVQ